jgi:hypothetical protein
LEVPQPCRIGGGAADRLDNAVALDYGRALADRRAAVIVIHDPRTMSDGYEKRGVVELALVDEHMRVGVGRHA